MSSSSLLGDLSKRVRRFGKSPKTVPGTYMSAAGIQSEVHPTTLARLAVHETMYRRQLHVYRQDLANTVYTIRRDQRMLRKSVEEYSRKQKLNKANKYIPSMFEPVSKSEEEFKKVPEKKVRISLPPLDVSLLGEFPDSKFMTDSRDTFHSEGAHSERMLETIAETESDDNDQTGLNGESNLNQPDETPKNNEYSQSKSNEIFYSMSEGNIDQEIPVGDNKEDLKTSTNLTSASEVILRKEVPAKKHQKPHQSETSSFMELVRMKNKSGLTKNLKVIDKLVRESRNRRFAYLTKVTTVHEDQVDSGEEATKNNNRRTSIVDLPQVKITFENTGADSSKSDRDHLDVKNNGAQLKPFPPESTFPPGNNDNIPEFNKVGQQNPIAKQPESLQVTGLHRSRRLSIPARQLDKFLLNEKIKTENYKDDVTWQQSLASIRDVHYIRNRNDYEEFALKVLQEAETSLKPLEK